MGQKLRVPILSRYPDHSMPSPAPIVILNGPPRCGKTSIAAAMQETIDRPWMNLGVDVYARHVTPPAWQPGIGLRPGAEDRPEIQELIPTFYAALYDSIAAHSRLGLAVVSDLGHHVATQEGMAILKDCARRVSGLPVLFVGVSAPIDVIMERRRASASEGGPYVAAPEGEPPPAPVMRWQEATAASGLYDFEVDTSVVSPGAAAEMVFEWLAEPPAGPTAFERLAPTEIDEG
jgi:chloramphenicol 3-O phosphotransferase